MGELRKPFFIAAVVAIVVAFFLELGSTFAIEVLEWLFQSHPAPSSPPGYAIRCLAFVDGMLVLSVTLMTMALFVRESWQARIQGFITLVVALLGLLAALAYLFMLITLIFVMIGLFMAIPFGTLIYLAAWGVFPRGEATAILGILMILKIAFAVLLVVAQQRFLLNTRLVVLVVLSLVGNLLVGFLQGFVPGPLVSILDVVAAIVLVIVGLVMALVLLIGSIPAIVKALKPMRLASDP